MDIAERLAKERRGRLAAERLLEQKQRELFAANEKLSLHARSLSDQIVEQRQVVAFARSEAAELKGQNSRFIGDLDRAHTAAVMAERRLWDSIETIRDGFAVFDSTLRLVGANRAWLDLFAGGDLPPGTPYGDMLAEAGAKGRIDFGDEGMGPWLDRMTAQLDQDQIPTEVVAFTRGTWSRLSQRRARDGDLVCILADITEEMRIWAAIEAIPDGFVLFDREERLLACNQRYRDMFPDSAPLMVPGTPFEELLRNGLRAGHVPEAAGREEEWLAERMAQLRAADGPRECQLNDGRWILER
ncbi:MAG: PAS-domain containing protein, partial [Pseudomonadota bacterium]